MLSHIFIFVIFMYNAYLQGVAEASDNTGFDIAYSNVSLHEMWDVSGRSCIKLETNSCNFPSVNCLNFCPFVCLLTFQHVNQQTTKFIKNDKVTIKLSYIQDLPNKHPTLSCRLALKYYVLLNLYACRMFLEDPVCMFHDDGRCLQYLQTTLIPRNPHWISKHIKWY